MGHWLLAVLVRGTATINDIDAHLAKPMRALLREHHVDAYRLGGQVTGAWDPDYDPAADPANWRPCGTCGGSTRAGRDRCATCATAVQAGRPVGTVVAWHHADWAKHPGDIVELLRLLDPAWRFPRGTTPIAWVDLAGVEWLGTEIAVLTGTDTGEVPPPLRRDQRRGVPSTGLRTCLVGASQACMQGHALLIPARHGHPSTQGGPL